MEKKKKTRRCLCEDDLSCNQDDKDDLGMETFQAEATGGAKALGLEPAWGVCAMLVQKYGGDRQRLKQRRKGPQAAS